MVNTATFTGRGGPWKELSVCKEWANHSPALLNERGSPVALLPVKTVESERWVGKPGLGEAAGTRWRTGRWCYMARETPNVGGATAKYSELSTRQISPKLLIIERFSMLRGGSQWNSSWRLTSSKISGPPRGSVFPVWSKLKQRAHCECWNSPWIQNKWTSDNACSHPTRLFPFPQPSLRSFLPSLTPYLPSFLLFFLFHSSKLSVFHPSTHPSPQHLIGTNFEKGLKIHK